jgi:hypothetical protein
MTWARAATLIDAVRHPATVIIAIAFAFVKTMRWRVSSYYEPSLRMLSRHFMFWLVVSLVALGILFTVLVVFAEIRAKRAEERERIPEARARQREAPADAAPAVAQRARTSPPAPIVAPPPAPPAPGPGDEPTLLK